MPSHIYYSCGLYPKWVLNLWSCPRDWTLWLLLDHTKMRKDAVWLAGDRSIPSPPLSAGARPPWASASTDPERPGLLLRLGEARFHAEQVGAKPLTEAPDGLRFRGHRRWPVQGCSQVVGRAGHATGWRVDPPAGGQRVLAADYTAEANAQLQQSMASTARAPQPHTST
jgi:hypothetical protein